MTRFGEKTCDSLKWHVSLNKWAITVYFPHHTQNRKIYNVNKLCPAIRLPVVVFSLLTFGVLNIFADV